MKKSDCKPGIDVFVRGCPSYRATVRAVHAEDVHLDWPQAAIDHQARSHDRPLPSCVGFADVTEVVKTPQATEEAAPDAGSNDGTDAYADWRGFWYQFEKLLDDRRALAKDLRAALPLAKDTTINQDAVISLSSSLVNSLGLMELQNRTIEIHERLDNLKLEAGVFLERTYKEFLL